jgi:GntR family transcriptional repressor for pyruvate dehydrogenase complex
LSVKDAAASIELFLKLKQSPQSLQNVSEVRRMIEVEAAGLAAERATPDDIAKIRKAIDGMQSAGIDAQQYAEYDVAFHTAIAQATHNELISVLLGPISELLAEMVRVSLNAPNAAEEGLVHHRHIIQHIRAHDCEAAREAMRAHIEHAHTLVISVQNREKSEGE